MGNIHLHYLSKNKFKGTLDCTPCFSHIAGKEKEGKALHIGRFSNDSIGKDIAVVYNMFTRDTYIVPGEGDYIIDLGAGKKIEISMDEDGVISPCLYIDGKGIPSCQYNICEISYMCYNVKVDENGVKIKDLSHQGEDQEGQVIILQNEVQNEKIYKKVG